MVGVHTPEFPFEQNVDNVRQAANDMNVWYPIADRTFAEASTAVKFARTCT